MFFTEASIEDSYIYKTFNASNGMIEKIVKYIKTSTILDKRYFEDKYIQISKSNISPIVSKVIKAFDRGDIELLYSRDAKISTAFPFVIRKTGNGKIVASIFIASFSKIDENDDLDIPMKQLYGLMESAYVAYSIQTEPSVMTRNIGLMKLTKEIYTKMFMKILNKEYGVSSDNQLHDTVSYCIARFYLERIWGYPNKETIESYAVSDLKFLDPTDLDFVKKIYSEANITTIEDFIKFLPTLSPRLKDINIRYFIEKYVHMYHGSSVLSIDYLPYLFFVIINTILSTFLISQPILGQIIKEVKNIDRFYSELYKVLN